MRFFDVHVGDIVMLRKPHPCGSYEWEVVRIGTDIGLKCCKCGRRVLLPRSKFNKRMKKFVSRAQSVSAEEQSPFPSSP